MISIMIIRWAYICRSFWENLSCATQQWLRNADTLDYVIYHLQFGIDYVHYRSIFCVEYALKHSLFLLLFITFTLLTCTFLFDTKTISAIYFITRNSFTTATKKCKLIKTLLFALYWVQPVLHLWCTDKHKNWVYYVPFTLLQSNDIKFFTQFFQFLILTCNVAFVNIIITGRLHFLEIPSLWQNDITKDRSCFNYKTIDC